MSDLISRKAVKKTVKEFFKTKVDEIPKREKFNKLCDLCDLYLELNADLHKVIEDIPVAYDVDKVVEQLQKSNHNYYPSIVSYCVSEKAVKLKDAIEIVKGAVKDE